MAQELNDFLKLMADAKRKKEEQEKEAARQKLAENSSFLGELFEVVSKNKPQEEVIVEVESQETKVIVKDHSLEIEQVLTTLKGLEDKALEIEKSIELQTVNHNELKDTVDAKMFDNTQMEKKFLDLYKRLQDDFTNLKKYLLNQRSAEISMNSVNTGIGLSGGGAAFDRNVFFQNDNLPLRVPTIAPKEENFLLYKVDGEFVTPYIWIPD